MDWSKTKNVLIVAFIITNLILTYVLFENKSSEDTLNQKFINDVKEKLIEKDVKVSTEIPLGTPSLSKLNVEYELYTPIETAKLFFNSFSQRAANDGYIYRSGNERLEILDNNKKIIYTNLNTNRKYSELSKKRVNTIVDVFIQEKGFDGNDYKLVKYDDSKLPYTLEYVKVYKGIYVEETYMIFEIDYSGVKRFERQWLNTRGVGDKVSVTSAPNALITLLSKEDVQGKIIEDISLSYYLDLQNEVDKDSNEIISNNIMAGEAIPVWRIEFSDGTKKFLK